MFDVAHIIQTGGLLAIGFIVFAETGLLVGFFLPGDSLLVLGGIFAAKGDLPLGWLMATVTLCAIAGYQVGYYIGEKAGPHVFKREDGILFRREYVERTHRFFEKYGAVAILLARFIPIVRTFVSVVAGVGNMDKKMYATYNIIGAILWGCGVVLLGYLLGNLVPDLEKYMFLIMILIIVGSFAATGWHIFKHKDARQHLAKEVKAEWNHFFGRKK